MVRGSRNFEDNADEYTLLIFGAGMLEERLPWPIRLSVKEFENFSSLVATKYAN